MPILVTDLMPGVLHETWEGSLSATELYESQDRLLARMEAEQGTLYIVIVEPRPQLNPPSLSVMINSAKRFPRGKVQYFVLNTSRFNTAIVNMLTRFTPFPVTLYNDLETAVEAARKLMAQHQPDTHE